MNIKEDLTRVFYVVDSEEDNEELFETLEGAEAHLVSVINSGVKGRLYIAQVRNAYREPINDEWNYEDRSDTFNIIQILNWKQ